MTPEGGTATLLASPCFHFLCFHCLLPHWTLRVTLFAIRVTNDRLARLLLPAIPPQVPADSRGNARDDSRQHASRHQPCHQPDHDAEQGSR